MGVELEPIATNGLLPDQEAALQHCLRQLQAFDARRAMMGTNEATAIVNLMREIKTRISPPSPQDLQERTNKIIQAFRPETVGWVGDILEGVI